MNFNSLAGQTLHTLQWNDIINCVFYPTTVSSETSDKQYSGTLQVCNEKPIGYTYIPINRYLHIIIINFAFECMKHILDAIIILNGQIGNTFAHSYKPEKKPFRV